MKPGSKPGLSENGAHPSLALRIGQGIMLAVLIITVVFLAILVWGSV